MNRRGAQGQSSIEYLIAVLAVVIALFAGSDPMLDRLIRALAHYQSGFTQGVSRP